MIRIVSAVDLGTELCVVRQRSVCVCVFVIIVINQNFSSIAMRYFGGF